MGIDAEALLLERAPRGWKVVSWAYDLPRTSLTSERYALLSRLLDDLQLPAFAGSPELQQKVQSFDGLEPQYQMLKLPPGQVVTEVQRFGEALDETSGLCHSERFFFAHGLVSYAEALCDFMEPLVAGGELNEEQVRAFWHTRDSYGAVLRHALLHSLQPGAPQADLSLEFHCSSEDSGLLRLEASQRWLIGYIDLELSDAVSEGYITLQDVKSDSKSCGDHCELTFSGSGEISLDVGSCAVQILLIRTVPPSRVRVRLRPPETVMIGESVPMDDHLGMKPWLLCVLMALRRHLPQVATALIAKFARPVLPFRQVAIGLSHDHICWEQQEWEYLSESCLPVLAPCGEEAFVAMLDRLRRIGCHIPIPRWHSM